MKRMRGHAGFTLVEVVIVIAIIGILAVIGLPSLIKTMPRTRLTNNTRTLANEIASLRMQAIAKSLDFRMVFDVAANTYTLERANGAGWTLITTTRTGGSDMTSVAGFSPDANILVLGSFGSASVPLGSQATIVLETPFSPPATEGEMQRQVVVQSTGRVFIRKRSIGSSWVNE